jgi:hypothetical protein
MLLWLLDQQPVDPLTAVVGVRCGSGAGTGCCFRSLRGEETYPVRGLGLMARYLRLGDHVEQLQS